MINLLRSKYEARAFSLLRLPSAGDATETVLGDDTFDWAYTNALPDSPGFNGFLKGDTKGFLPPSMSCVLALIVFLTVGVTNPEGGSEALSLEAVDDGVAKLDEPGWDIAFSGVLNPIEGWEDAVGVTKPEVEVEGRANLEFNGEWLCVPTDVGLMSIGCLKGVVTTVGPARGAGARKVRAAGVGVCGTVVLAPVLISS